MKMMVPQSDKLEVTRRIKDYLRFQKEEGRPAHRTAKEFLENPSSKGLLETVIFRDYLSRSEKRRRDQKTIMMKNQVQMARFHLDKDSSMLRRLSPAKKEFSIKKG